MKRNTIVLALLVLFKLVAQCLGNRHYGFHRDELLHLSVSEHLAWGFMEFPPFIGLLGKLSYLFFDYSLMGVRLFSTLAGIGILILTYQIAKELKGNQFSAFLAGICVLAFLPFYRNHTLFQPVAFDQLFWTLGFYYIVRFINSQDKKYLLFIGMTLGIGLMNKYTMFMWAFGMFIGLIFYKKGSLFKNKWFYLSGVVALGIFTPNLLWQIENGIPFLGHLQSLHESQLSELNPLEFGLEQLNYPMTLVVSILGVVYLLASKTYKSIGLAALVIFFLMWLLKSKSYYVFALYPILFAAGAVQISQYINNRHAAWKYVIVVLLLFSSLYHIPHLTPILSIDDYVSYADLPEEKGRVDLTGDYADMFGWEEQCKLVDSVYNSLSPNEKDNCVLWAENYGEAGALKIIGKKYNLPNPICRSGSFWSWGYGNKDAKIWISLGNEDGALDWIFEEKQLVRMIHHKYAIGEENGIPLYICRKPKRDIPQWWKDFEPYIFN